MAPRKESPEMRRFRWRVRLGLLLVALLPLRVFLVGLESAGNLPLPGDGPADSRRAPSGAHREGEWEVTRLGHLRLSHFWPGPHRLLVGCEEKAPELWDTESGKRVAALREQPGTLQTCASAPGGSLFVTAAEVVSFRGTGGRGQIFLWETATGKLVKQIDVDVSGAQVRDSTDWQIHWLDRRTLLLQCHHRWGVRASEWTVLGLVDVERGRVVKMSNRLEIGEELVLSPDGKRAFTTRQYWVYKGAHGGISWVGRGVTYETHLVDLAELGVVALLDGRPWESPADRKIHAGTWSPDGRYVATVGSDHTACVWDGQTGQLVSQLLGHTDWILSVCFSADGALILTASEDDTARVWESATGKPVATLLGHTAGLYQAVFDPTATRVVTGSEDQTARLWDARTGKLLRAWPGHESNVREVEFLEGGKQVRTQTVRGVVRIWSAEDGALLSEERLGRNVSYRYDNCFLRDSGGITEVWVGPPSAVPPVKDREERLVFGETVLRDDSPDYGLAQPRLTLKGHKHDVKAVAFTADGKTLASAGEDKVAILWDLERWDRVTGAGRVVLRQPVPVRSMALAKTGRTLATGGEDGSVRLWDAAAARERAVVPMHPKSVQCLAFSPDGSALASAGYDNTVTVWEVAAARERFRIDGALETPTAVAFTPDGRVLAASGRGGADHTGLVVLWDAATGKELRRLRGHTAEVTGIAFSPDGNVLASAGMDRTVKFWDVATGKERVTLTGHSAWVVSVAFSADGKLLASGDWEGTIRLWDAINGKERAAFKGHITWVNSLAFTPDGKTLASGAGDLLLWDVEELLKRSVAVPNR
jgi:WD40 repeat protein